MLNKLSPPAIPDHYNLNNIYLWVGFESIHMICTLSPHFLVKSFSRHFMHEASLLVSVLYLVKSVVFFGALIFHGRVQPFSYVARLSRSLTITFLFFKWII